MNTCKEDVNLQSKESRNQNPTYKVFIVPLHQLDKSGLRQKGVDDSRWVWLKYSAKRSHDAACTSCGKLMSLSIIHFMRCQKGEEVR